ncbi:MAG: cation diffusion facilitator family transporter [Pararhodobacter sp.]
MTDLAVDPEDHAVGRRQLRKLAAALGSLVVTSGLTLGKLVVGVLSGSLALIADALQGLMDVIVTMVTLMVVAVSGRQADAVWTCGRARIEALAALVEAALLAVIAACIWYLAAQKLVHGVHDVTVEPWYLAVVLAMVAVDWARAQFLGRVARETDSIALEANAAHFRTDALSSLVVLGGLVAVHQGWPLADTLATFVVAGFLSWTAWRLGRRGADLLLDRADPQASLAVLAAIESQPGVQDVRVLRLHRQPDHYRVEAALRVRVADIEALRLLEDQIRRAITTTLPRAETTLALSPE